MQTWAAATRRATNPALPQLENPNNIPYSSGWPGRLWDVDDDGRIVCLNAHLTWRDPSGHEHHGLGRLFVGETAPCPVLGLLIELDRSIEPEPPYRLTPQTVAAAATAFMRRSDYGVLDEDPRLVRNHTDPAEIRWIVEHRLVPPDFRTATRHSTYSRAILIWDQEHDRYDLAPGGWGVLTDADHELLNGVELHNADDIIWDMNS
jgi:hypothetical protein